VKQNRRVAGTGAAAVFALFACHPAQAAAPEQTPFAIQVTASDAGIELRCLRGCAWTTLEHGCRKNAPCWAKVDEHGLEGEVNPAADATELVPFRLLITVGGAGFSTQCKGGCAWKSLTYRCGPSGSCTATVDKFGVRGPDLPAE
jgi:hypothetical protein